MTISELNAMDREPFVAAIGWVFEDSPWVARARVGSRPFATRDALHRAMTQQVESAAARGATRAAAGASGSGRTRAHE